MIAAVRGLFWRCVERLEENDWLNEAPFDGYRALFRTETSVSSIALIAGWVAHRVLDHHGVKSSCSSSSSVSVSV